jgi:hypothetical protein
MNLKIESILDRGIPGKERLWMKAASSIDLGFYVVFSSRFEGSGVSSRPKHVHWWENYPVKAGDWVILYTGPGEHKTSQRRDGGANHFFHWGYSDAIWREPNSCAVLLELAGWETWPARYALLRP